MCVLHVNNRVQKTYFCKHEYTLAHGLHVSMSFNHCDRLSFDTQIFTDPWLAPGTVKTEPHPSGTRRGRGLLHQRQQASGSEKSSETRGAPLSGLSDVYPDRTGCCPEEGRSELSFSRGASRNPCPCACSQVSQDKGRAGKTSGRSKEQRGGWDQGRGARGGGASQSREGLRSG